MRVNEPIGYWRCDAGAMAQVMQTKRRGNHLYTRCDCCGLDQRTGAARQTRLWSETEFIAGVTVRKPSNVTEREPDIEPVLTDSEPELTEVRPEPATDFDPMAGGPETEAQPVQGKSWPRLLAGVALLGSGVGGWLWTRK